MKQDPEFLIFTGPMFGSKTTKMLAALERYKYRKMTVGAFKPRMDDRYSQGEIVTHSGLKWIATNVSTGKEILAYANDYDVIAVDEAFMIDDIAKILVQLFHQGKTIVVSSIQLSATGKIFDEIMWMMPWATYIKVCPAVCPISGKDAYYTYRKIAGLSEIEVGGEELYEPRSWKHHPALSSQDE